MIYMNNASDAFVRQTILIVLQNGGHNVQIPSGRALVNQFSGKISAKITYTDATGNRRKAKASAPISACDQVTVNF